MKRKLGMLFASCLLVLLITSCDEVLSVVTPGENGEKVVNNYVSMFSDKVYDESVSIKTWNNLDIFEDKDVVEIVSDPNYTGERQDIYNMCTSVSVKRKIKKYYEGH